MLQMADRRLDGVRRQRNPRCEIRQRDGAVELKDLFQTGGEKRRVIQWEVLDFTGVGGVRHEGCAVHSECGGFNLKNLVRNIF